ncbi:DNRLRE domain-containing protein [Nonomuraea guangzhouensis]|uniref:DNRLRE domain-containing protein n=1 Tax=Nonomuraea guangzhouensis TaxID=1291555 RepID=A0ABW4GAQ1_9ACTN|nr:DNRLRE domain-containing protein [Nonomuraea guangzhouensis]
MSAPAIAQGPTPPPITTPTPMTPPKAPATPTGKALAQAKKDNRRIEIESLRSENATYYANPDGKTLRLEQYLEPIRVKNAGGDGFAPIDTTLVEADGVIKPKAAKGSLTLSPGGDTEAIKTKNGNLAAQIDAPSTLPRPKLNGSTATYSSAYGKGIDLVVTATATGFRQQIVIRERPAGPVTFRVPVDLPKGISFGKNAKGQPTLKSGNGKHSLDIRPAALLDAVAADANADLGAVRVGRAQVSLDGSALVYGPDPAFLADPATTYPVTMAAVDDDWYECTLGTPCPPGDPMDTYINDVDLTDSWDMHYRDQMWVGKSYASNIAKRWRAYIQFPLPQSGDPFWGSRIQNADLELWNYLSNDCGEFVGSGITARQVTSDWDHLTLQWSDQPSVTNAGADTEYGAYSPDCSGSMNYEHDLIHSVDTIVQAWADGETNYGFRLSAGDESELRNWRRYRSREQTSGYPAHGPRLTVDFEPPAPARQETVVIAAPEPLGTLPTDYDQAVAMSTRAGRTVEEFGSIDVPDAVLDATLANHNGMADTVGTDKFTPDEVGVPEPDDTGSGDGEDTLAPRVLTHEPAAGVVEVPLDAVARVTFTEPVGNAEVTVRADDGTTVSGSLAYSDDDKVVTFTPAQPLAPGTTYSAEVAWAIDGVENTMEPYSWSFRTVDQMTGRWTFDEGDGRTAADSSGNDHDASLNDTAAWIAGKSGNAISNVPSQARIAASQAATKQGKAVEVTGETTATSITYAQPDGKTYKTEVTAGPVRTEQAGRWVPIDTTLVEQGGRLKPKAMAEDAVVEISAGGTDPFVKMSADGKSYALRWPTPLPKPTVKGSVATYTDAAGVGADLVVMALPTGFRHEVVLRQRPSKPLELRIGVDDEGLTLTEGKGGRLLLKGRDKKLIASAGQPIVSDGSAKGRLPLAKHAKADTDVVTKDGRTELVVKPDQAFLTGAGTTYPVRVAAAVTLPLGADVEVSTNDTVDSPAWPDGLNIMAGTMTGGMKSRTHLRFDTTGLPGSTVTDATLSMNTVHSPNCGAALANGIQVARLTSAWDPDNMYWAGKPALTTEDASTNFKGVNSDCAVWPDSMDWKVTGIAQDWAAGAANHGLVLKSPGEANIDNYRVFTSSEDADFNLPPKLTITTSGPASAPTVSAPAITPAQIVNGTTVTTSLTPQLAATVADTAQGSLTGQFEVEHDPAATGQGSGQIWTGASPVVASGGQATVSVPAGRLADGWKIRWRVRAVNATAATTSAWSNWQTATADVPNPTVGAFQVTPSQMVNGVTVATSLTPALRATVTDPAAQPLRGEFQVEHDPAATGQGSGQIWTGAVDGVASGTQASASVPDGKLTDGWKVRWRVRAINTATTVGSPWSDWQALTVDVPDPVSEPAVGALQVTPSQQVDGTTVTPTRTPTLLAQVNDPAGKPLRAEVEVEHDPAAPGGQGSGQIWAGSADNVPAGAQASIAVPADKLTDGWKVRWRARAVSPTAGSAWSDWQSFTVSLPKPTATGLTIAPSKVVDGVTVTTTLTPTMKATLTHPTGQALRAEVEVEHDPAAPGGQGSGQIWTGNVDNVASGTQASIAVPADKLANGWKVRWRLRAVADDVSSVWSGWQQVTVNVTQPGEEPLAQTAGPVIRTDQSFTAAAWLRWSDKEGDYLVAEQRGNHQAPFRLGNTAEHGLVFTFTNADATDATVEGVLSGIEPPVDEWFHLAGTYDAAARTATLYLNGAQAGTAKLSFPVWDAQAPLRIGAAMAGSIDEVRGYQRPLTAAGVAYLFTRPQTVQTAAAPSAKASPAPRASTTTTGVSSAASSDGGFYKRVELDDCQALDDNYDGDTADTYVTWMKGEYAFGQSRIHESTYNYCWSSYIYVLEFAENPFTGGMVRAAKRSLLKKAKKKNGQSVEVEDDDAFRFRATWVMHTYLGGTGGKEFSQGQLSAQTIKIFSRLDGFAVVDGDGDVKVPSNDLSGIEMKVHPDSGAGQCRYQSGPRTLRDVSAWNAAPDAEFLLGWNGTNSGVQRCEVGVVVFIPGEDEGTGLAVPLWNRKLVDSRYKVEENTVLRHGSGIPVSDWDGYPYTELVPVVQCDWQQLGGFGVPHRIGGCIIPSVPRVFVMSKSRNANFLQVIQHIEKALNSQTNVGTAPPKRLGHNWAEPKYPPAKTTIATPVSKLIPGNWADPFSKPLTKVSTTDANVNRTFFSRLQFVTDKGTSAERRWPDVPEGTTVSARELAGVNYCKYYFYDKYAVTTRWLHGVPQAGWINCDEYPFASTKEGAGMKDGNYSIQAVDRQDNLDHGDAVNKFYADYRVVPGEKFWVKIVS